jgi:hypothetical protein
MPPPKPAAPPAPAAPAAPAAPVPPASEPEATAPAHEAEIIVPDLVQPVVIIEDVPKKKRSPKADVQE